MKQKKVKPRPTLPKKEWSCAYVDDGLDWIGDCKRREYKKSEKYKQGQILVEKFKSKKT